MPLKRCKSDGKSGWKYGDSGHCYTGPGAKKKAIKQGLAESYRSGEKFSPSDKKSTASEAELDKEVNKLISLDEVKSDDLQRARIDASNNAL